MNQQESILNGEFVQKLRKLMKVQNVVSYDSVASSIQLEYNVNLDSFISVLSCIICETFPIEDNKVKRFAELADVPVAHLYYLYNRDYTVPRKTLVKVLQLLGVEEDLSDEPVSIWYENYTGRGARGRVFPENFNYDIDTIDIHRARR